MPPRAKEERYDKDTVGDYRLGEELGVGSFGQVRAAAHTKTGREVAIKIISAGKIRDARQKEQLRREVAIMKKLDHPNVVKLIDVFQNRRYIFIVMEKVTGGDLYEALERKRKFTEPEARKIFRQILAGVAHCHGRGTCSRDIKVENVLLTPGGGVKLADFGLGQSILGDGEEEVLLKTLCGTPSYIPPEVLSQEPYQGSKCDVWSLGVMLFFVVAGRMPFRDGDNEVLFRDICRGNYRFPLSFSPDLRGLLSSMMTLDPAVRPTAAVLEGHPWFSVVDDVEPERADEDAAAEPVPPPPSAETSPLLGEQFADGQDETFVVHRKY